MKILISTVALAGLVAGCAVQPIAPAANPQITVRCVYPTISPLAQTKELQSQGGINVSLAPGNFQCTKAGKQSKAVVSPTFGEQMEISLASGGKGQLYQLVETTITPIYTVNPDKIAFRVKINNQMPRVFRGAGTVVLYNFGGKNTSTSQQDYAELNNLIVPPRTEAEVTIYGPSFRDMPEKATLGIFLYDVVTRTDQAGNIVEKQNFEWYYNYQNQYKEDVAELVKRKEWVLR